MLNGSSLYTPKDVLQAHAAWGASCGPAALAALLGEPVFGLKPLFPRPWTTPTVMKAALLSRGRTFQAHSSLTAHHQRGLAFIQLQGAWDTAPERVQYQHTHWVAFATAGAPVQRFIYDVNALAPSLQGDWALFEQWESGTLRLLCAAHPRASGLWRVRLSLELRP